MPKRIVPSPTPARPIKPPGRVSVTGSKGLPAPMAELDVIADPGEKSPA
jgi:hypothetical protein